MVAFDRGEDGELFPAFGPADQQSEERAIRTAKALAGMHVGVIAWSRDANPALGDYGPPTLLFTSGDVPELAGTCFATGEKVAGRRQDQKVDKVTASFKPCIIVGMAFAGMASGCMTPTEDTSFPTQPTMSRVLFITTDDLTLSCKGQFSAPAQGSPKTIVPLKCNTGIATAELEFLNKRVSYGRLLRPDGKSGNMVFNDTGTDTLLGLAGALNYHP